MVEVESVTVTTMQVSIRVMQVNNKQMTLSVFRQLPNKKELAEAIVWGLVRYSIKEEGDLWLVHSENGELFRREIRVKCRSSVLPKRLSEWGYYCALNSLTDLHERGCVLSIEPRTGTFGNDKILWTYNRMYDQEDSDFADEKISEREPDMLSILRDGSCWEEINSVVNDRLLLKKLPQLFIAV